MSDMTETTPGWLTSRRTRMARARMPILYVEAVPVRVDDSGEVTSIGLLLRIGSDGTVSRTLVSGRVMHHERVRDALLRHLEKDLGPVALPRVPASLQPFTVAEYFPTQGITPFHDPRQHAVVPRLHRAGDRRLPPPAGRAGPGLVQPAGGRVGAGQERDAGRPRGPAEAGPRPRGLSVLAGSGSWRPGLRAAVRDRCRAGSGSASPRRGPPVRSPCARAAAQPARPRASARRAWPSQL